MNWNWLNPFNSFYKNRFNPFDGFKPFNFWNTTPVFNNYGDDMRKLKAVFESPALLKVFCLQCDLYSLGRITVKQGEKDLPDDPALKVLHNPNPMQSRSQLQWDYMFWNMMGTAYCYVDSKVPEKVNNKLYFLENQKIEFPTKIQQTSDHLIFSVSKENEMWDTEITYRYNNGTSIKIPLKKILILTDLTNGTGNWFKSNSRIDALYKVISNSEASLDSNNINIRFSGKFMVAGTTDPNDVTKLPLSETEKKDIQKKVNGYEEVTAVKSMIDIKRFVENMKAQQLDEKYLASYFVIGNMFNIPRDVLEAYNSSTFENQEKARGGHVSYTLQPKGDDFMNALTDHWGYTEQGKKICISWDHLPFMQVFEKERASTKQILANTFASLQKSGVSLPEANSFLGTNFTNIEKPEANTTA